MRIVKLGRFPKPVLPFKRVPQGGRTARTLGTHNRQAGLSLLELLVAVLVTAIGVLGVTSLQMLSLQGNRLALQRNEAVMLAYDIMDRARANPGGVYGPLNWNAQPPATADCVANICNAGQIATFDQAVWKCSLGNWRTNSVCTGLVAAGVIPTAAQQPGLPNGDGQITIAGTTVTVTVRWVDPTSAQPMQITIASQT